MPVIKRKYLLMGVVFIGVAWMIRDSVTQDGPDDLKGGFEQKLFVRNEQNTGPVVRLYAVTVKDTVWSEMKIYGNYMPHSKYGITRVYYFIKGKHLPDRLNIEDPNLTPEDEKLCIAKYEKDPMGQVSLVRYAAAVAR